MRRDRFLLFMLYLFSAMNFVIGIVEFKSKLDTHIYLGLLFFVVARLYSAVAKPE